MYYFAYGSNLYSRRLAARLDHITPLGTRLLPGYSLRFHKVGWRDQSAKCDAYQTHHHSDVLYGMLYDIGAQQLPILDAIEGVGQGYEKQEVTLYRLLESAGLQNVSIAPAETALTYIANRIDDQLLPYDWYVQHVLQGAIEANFPEHYIDRIRRTPSIPDLDQARASLEWALHQGVD